MTQITLPALLVAALVAGFFRLQSEFGTAIALEVIVAVAVGLPIVVLLHRRFAPVRSGTTLSAFDPRRRDRVGAIACVVGGTATFVVSVAGVTSASWFGLVPAALALVAVWRGVTYPRRTRREARRRLAARASRLR